MGAGEIWVEGDQDTLHMCMDFFFKESVKELKKSDNWNTWLKMELSSQHAFLDSTIYLSAHN